MLILLLLCGCWFQIHKHLLPTHHQHPWVRPYVCLSVGVVPENSPNYCRSIKSFRRNSLHGQKKDHHTRNRFSCELLPHEEELEKYAKPYRHAYLNLSRHSIDQSLHDTRAENAIHQFFSNQFQLCCESLYANSASEINLSANDWWQMYNTGVWWSRIFLTAPLVLVGGGWDLIKNRSTERLDRANVLLRLLIFAEMPDIKLSLWKSRVYHHPCQSKGPTDRPTGRRAMWSKPGTVTVHNATHNEIIHPGCI